MVALERLHAHGYFYSLPFVRNAYLFVDFFFVLSGFVIAYTYLDRLKDGGRFWDFAIRRFGRLWPLHVFVLLVFVAFEAVKLGAQARGIQTGVAPFTGTQSPDTILTNILLVHSLGIYDYLTWNFPSWSISTEFWTYLVFAAVAILGRKHMTAIAAAIVFAGLAVVALFSPDAMNATYDYGFARCLAGFFVGYLVYVLWQAKGLSLIGPQTRLPLLEIALTALVIGFVSVAKMTLISIAAPFVFALVVYVFAFEGGPVTRLLKTPLFHAMGVWSYSIYMVNLFIVLMIERLANVAERMLGQPVWKVVDSGGYKLLSYGPKITMDLLALVYLAVVLLVSWATYTMVEAPSRTFFNRLATRTRPAPSSPEQTAMKVHVAAPTSAFATAQAKPVDRLRVE